MVIHLKQNYISHLPPGLHDGWQGPQPKHPGLIAPLFSVTNVTRKTYGNFRFPALLNENMFVIGEARQKICKGLCHTEFQTTVQPYLKYYNGFLIYAETSFPSPSGLGDGHIMTDWFMYWRRLCSCCDCVYACVCQRGGGTQFVNKGGTHILHSVQCTVGATVTCRHDGIRSITVCYCLMYYNTLSVVVLETGNIHGSSL